MIRELIEKIKLLETPEEDAKFKKRYEEEKAKEEDAKFKKRYEEEKAKEKAEADAKAKADADAKAKADADAKAKADADAKAKEKQKTLLPVDKNVKALQDEVVTAGGKFPKYGADGRWGNETAGVVFSDPKFVEIARKYADTIPQVKGILATKDFAKDVGARADAAVSSLPSAGGAVKTDASNSAAQAVAPGGQSEEDRKAEWAKWNAEKDANNAKSAAVAQLKTLVKPKEQVGRLQYAIDPKDGIIYYGKARESSTEGDPSPIAFTEINKVTYRDIAKIVKDAGLTIKSVPKEYLFGTYQMAGVDVAQLNSLINPQNNSAAQADNSVETNPYSLNYGNPKSSTPGLKDPNLEFQKQMRAQAMKSPPPTPLDVKESVGFQSDELNRIVSLIHHR